MPEPSVNVVRLLDDRSPFLSARATVVTITRLSEDLRDPDAVLEAVIRSVGVSYRRYIETIASTRHSVFYHQLQTLHEFGRRRVRPEASEGFCRAAGRTYMEFAFDESIYHVLQMALARPGTFQATVIEMLQSQFYRRAGEKYIFAPEIRDDEIRLELSYRRPKLIAQYLELHGLDPERCFRNSFEFIGGAMEAFVERIIAGYDGSRFQMDQKGLRGRLHLPIGKDDHFAYDRLIPTLIGYIGSLRDRQEAARADELLESELVAEAPKMQETWGRIRRASRSDEIVLLRGESGTGKSFIAQKIHHLSPRREAPFVQVGLTADLGSDNLIQSDLFGHERGAFTGASEQKQGLFSLADGGTIFLDEIGDASSELQAKLLRVLETSTFKRLGGVRDIQVDVRVIAATNRNLEKMVSDGTFRQDLYYRLNVIPIDLPPLRERRDDIPALTEFLLARSQARGKGVRRTFAPGLSTRMRTYDWPGNVRELEHAIKHAVAMAEGDTITTDDLPAAVRDGLRAGALEVPKEPVVDPRPPIPGEGEGETDADIIDVEMLRRRIREATHKGLGGEPLGEDPAHIGVAKRIWLATLIEECGGDLGVISRFWDRSSEKTLRNLIRSYGLSDLLAVARSQARSTSPRTAPSDPIPE